jgi:AAA15 family ATPase/GTPase
MAGIEGIKIKNYRTLKNITLGKLWNSQTKKSLTPMTAVIGKNGAGKSTLFDAFGFLADCLKNGVEEACDARGRGGFQRIRSQGENGSIDFELYIQRRSNFTPHHL